MKGLKRAVAVALVLLLVATAVAVAHPGEKKHEEHEAMPPLEKRPEKPAVKNWFMVTGLVLDFEQGEEIELKVWRASGALRGKRGEEVEIEITPQTRVLGLRYWHEGTEARAVVHGEVRDGELVARNIAFLPPPLLTITGRVESVDEGSFTVKVITANRNQRELRGETVTVVYNDKTKFVYPDDDNKDLSEGDFVVVVGFTKDDSIYARRVAVKDEPEHLKERCDDAEETTECAEPADDTTPPAHVREWERLRYRNLLEHALRTLERAYELLFQLLHRLIP